MCQLGWEHVDATCVKMHSIIDVQSIITDGEPCTIEKMATVSDGIVLEYGHHLFMNVDFSNSLQ